MLIVSTTLQFKRMFKKLEPALQEEAIDKIQMFADTSNHQQLKAHKLKGRLKNRCSFSVNYKVRIVFMYESDTSVILTAIGTHDIYK